MNTEKLVMLCPREVISLEPAQLVDAEGRSTLAEDAVEEMVVCLAAIEAAWQAGEFSRLNGTLDAIIGLARRVGLPDVAHVARTAKVLVDARNDVALAAVVARLVRVGEVSLATLLEISYRRS